MEAAPMAMAGPMASPLAGTVQGHAFPAPGAMTAQAPPSWNGPQSAPISAPMPAGPMSGPMSGPYPGQPPNMMGFGPPPSMGTPGMQPPGMAPQGPGQPIPWQPGPAAAKPFKVSPQMALLFAIGTVCLAIFVIGLYLFFTTKF
jgi:hypothetical protein